MGAGEAKPSQKSAKDGDWPILVEANNKHRFLYVSGLPEVREESARRSQTDVVSYRTFSLRSDDANLFWAYWRAFERDYRGYYFIVHEPARHINGVYSVTFSLDVALAQRLLGVYL